MSAVAVALETSTRAPSLAVRCGAVTLASELGSTRPHASDLLPALAQLLAELGARPRDIGTIVVGTGPGSYTGLRVGVATALGLARGSGAVVRGLPSTETLVFGALQPGAEACVVIDARSNELYFARYRRSAFGVQTFRAPCVLSAAELDAELPHGALVLADHDAVRAGGLERRSDLRIDARATPSARAALELGLAVIAAAGAHSAAQVEPLYLRAFAAKSRRR